MSRLLLALSCGALLAGVPSAQVALRSTSLGDPGSEPAGLSSVTAVTAALAPPTGALDQPVLEPGWPVTVPSNQTYTIDPYRGVALADLDRDGRLEIIRPSTDGQVYVFRHDGTALPGWPVATVGFSQEAPAVADLDGDGSLEILVNTRGLTSGGRAYVFHADGTLAAGWPKNLNNNNTPGAPVAADLDGDGRLEVLIQERAYPIGYVHAFRLDGTPFGANWPQALDHVPAGTPAVGDLDGDGAPEVVTISYQSLFAFHADGTPVQGFPFDVAAAYDARFSYQSPVLADIDRDGFLEIVTACHRTASGCYVFRHDGTLQPGWPKSFGSTWTYCPPSVADVNGDGTLDIVCGRSGGTASGPAMYAWSATGALLPGFPIVHPGGAEAPPAVVDLDDDGVMEIVFDSNLMDASGNGWLHCVDATGAIEPGWPLQPTGFTHLNGAQFGDVDGDGRLEMVVVSRANQQVTIGVYEPAQTARLGRSLWRTYHQGDARRGLLGDQGTFELVGDFRPGGALRFEMYAPAGDSVAILAGPFPALVPIPGIGFLRIGGGVIVTVHASAVPAEGRDLFALPIPNDPSLVGVHFVTQGVAITQSGRVRALESRGVRIR
ncbi:MAG: VCBS repeat-containing protein [Planctomycetes bacterium]|nr:VCBS repeat-containing protein [Planctomycetota bacterium]